MPKRATTAEEVVEAVSNWNIGIGPDELHVALGWTPAELEHYQQTGDLPDAQAAKWEAAVTEQLEGPTPAAPGNPFLAGVVREDNTIDVDALQGPLPTTPEDHEVPDDFWRYYTRWRALPTGDGQWKVLGEHGEEDKDGPRRHDDQYRAQQRADELNRTEQYAAIGVPVPKS